MKPENSNAQKRIKVCIIDDIEDHREALKGVLLNDDRIWLYGEYDKGLTFINSLQSPFEPDVCLVDLELPDISGIECCKRIKEKNPNIHVIIITAFPSSDSLSEAKKMGADYIEKGTRGAILIDKIITSTKFWRDEQFISLKNDSDFSDIIQLAHQLKAAKNCIPDLSENQRKVLQLQKEGKSVDEIALILKMKPNTVRTHIERGLKKLNLPKLLNYINFQ